MNIKRFYITEFPTDELGVELNEKANFLGLLDTLSNDANGENVYSYIGVYDSLVRERLFERLAGQLEKPYKYIYEKWMSKYNY
tara:strand:- start:64 stop:312 length:249 start_codon:yes stop_codon:yes gene_type:complete